MCNLEPSRFRVQRGLNKSRTLAVSSNVRDVMRDTSNGILENNTGTKQVNVDFDRLVNSVETSIMADHADRTTVGIDPRHLLHKSNPGLYGTPSDHVRDLTNPREMYSILSYQNKSTEDLTTRFKQDLVKSIKTSGLLPKLTRTTSMHDFRRNPLKSDSLCKIPFQSSLNINEARLSNDQSGLKRNKTSIVDTRPHTDAEKENLSNLPRITRSVHTSVGEIRVKNNQNAHLGFPDLSSDDKKRSADTSGVDVKYSIQQQKRLLQIKEELSASDTKLDKWFSEMPNEVFDKAQRALMEESIKEKLQTYQNKRNKRNGFPNENVHIYVGSKVRKVPNTYLELRVDSFGKHLVAEKGDIMNRYKLQQKSMHKLKMRDIDELDKVERVQEDIGLTPRLSLHHRSLTTLALTKAKTSTAIPKNKQDVITIPTDRVMNTININASVDLDETKRERKHMSYFEEYTERLNMMKGVSDQQENEDIIIAPTNSASCYQGVHEEHEENMADKDKGAAKPTIVNLALKQPVPRKRNPIHNTHVVNEKGSSNNNQNSAEHHENPNDGHLTEQTDIVSSEIAEPEKSVEQKQEPIITTIPTAPTVQSSRTSTSSSIRSMAKSPLKKFNMLEVFAEHNKALEARMEQKNYHGHKLRDPTPKVTPPSVRLDLKDYPNTPKHPIKENLGIERSEVKMQDVVFRFEPGEVFITSKKPKQVGNSNYRSSERARIIYGKAVMKDDKKEGRIREHSKENFSSISLSSRLDGYKSELGRFESRALEGSITSLSGKEELPADIQPVTYLNDNGVLIRDIAIETDVLGSAKSDVIKQNTDKDKLAVEQFEMRTGSGLTDFIVDNNDGESLDSASAHEDQSTENTGQAVSKHTV